MTEFIKKYIIVILKRLKKNFMINKLKSVLLIILFMTTSISAETEKDKIFPYDIFQYPLSNGLNIVTVPYNSPGIAAFYIIVRVGSRNEIEEGVTGFAHFFEHMMFRGTEKYPKEKYEKVLKSIGASANANTSSDRTVYHIMGDASKLEKMFEIESDRFMNLKYSVHDFKTEAGAVKGEYTKNIANPMEQLRENIKNVAFDVHPYKHTTMGFFKDIVDMPNQYEYSLLFFDRYYRPEYCTILVVGDVTAEKVNSLAEKYFGNWKKGNWITKIPQEPEQKEIRYTHLQNSDIPPYLYLNYKGPAFSDYNKDVAVLNVIGGMMFSRRSDLYKKLVINEKKLRNLSFFESDSKDPDLIMIIASLKNKSDMQYVKDEIIKVLNDLKNNPVDEKLLADAKSNIKYSFAMRMDNPGSIASSLSYFIWLTEDPASINRYYALYDDINKEDIMKVAQKYFVDSGLTIATLSGDENCPVR